MPLAGNYRIIRGRPLSSPESFRKLSEESRLDAIRAAVECGVNLIDTAPAYNAGVAEQYVGKVLQELGVRQKMFIATISGIPVRPVPNPFRQAKKIRRLLPYTAGYAGYMKKKRELKVNSQRRRRRNKRCGISLLEKCRILPCRFKMFRASMVSSTGVFPSGQWIRYRSR